ncbi:response regulator receiver modulated diguanylate cyclase [Catenovulum agarivorans DS-2]|uniref:diguanylate cyclase n=1 Tax=Catenovulum agarivorans DS-2 TaxID=1328313 RepID=W7QND5_9ALTE|nr:diguanylate cyclase [Catenovulum agarivorans]EWH09423.1 response regulator receiver modulated diguanylate cyclase [Catenovulum agarivorans DS-2]
MISPALRILIVDDEKPNLVVLSNLLKTEAQITLASNGKAAIEKAQELKPDIILLDVVMPDQNGFEVIKQLKACEITRAIPVIFITALGDVASEETGFELGACDYISKPFHLGIVKARVKLHLTIARQCIMLEMLANVDPLTTIPNRRKFDEQLEAEWLIAQRNQQPLVLAMVDVDKFKQYNDHYGHAAGDKVLTQVAQALNKQLQRPRDFVARYGGEEFVIIIGDSDLSGAKAVLDNCRQAIEDLDIEHELSTHNKITISAGAIICTPNNGVTSVQALKQADTMLYQAKECGRNQVCWNE